MYLIILLSCQLILLIGAAVLFYSGLNALRKSAKSPDPETARSNAMATMLSAIAFAVIALVALPLLLM